MPYHTVQQGECLSSIALDYGFKDYRNIFNHPQNSELKRKRANPNTLYPGDQLFIPEKKEKPALRPTAQQHSFQIKKPETKFTLRLLANGKPRANESYQLVIDGQTVNGVTGNDGLIELTIAPNAQKGTLLLPEKKESYSLLLGYLDPLDEVSGIKARLKNLGYYGGTIGEEEDARFKSALERFQQTKQMPKTGRRDTSTRDAIKADYGS